MIEIKKFSPERWKDLKKIRLESLQKDSKAFASSFEEEKSLTKSEWMARIKNTLFAVVDDNPVGLIAYLANEKTKTKHIANHCCPVVAEKSSL